MIERFDDLEWLRLQRSPEKEKEYEQGFQGSSRVARAEYTGFALRMAIGEALAEGGSDPSNTPADPGTGGGGTGGTGSGGTPAAASGAGSTGGGSTAPPADGGSTESGTGADGGSTESGTGADGGAPNPMDALAALGAIPDARLGDALDKLHAATPTVLPRDRLKNRIAFRDAVAEEIRKRSLDDTHDLRGMALYELQFDLSLLAGANAGDSHAVMLEVLPPETCDVKAAGMSENEQRQFKSVVLAACNAEVEELSARLSRNSLTTNDSPDVSEAVARGVVAARFEDMLRAVDGARELDEYLDRAIRLLTTAKDSLLAGSALATRINTLLTDIKNAGWNRNATNWENTLTTASQVNLGRVGYRDHLLVTAAIDQLAAAAAELDRNFGAGLTRLRRDVEFAARSRAAIEDLALTPTSTSGGAASGAGNGGASSTPQGAPARREAAEGQGAKDEPAQGGSIEIQVRDLQEYVRARNAAKGVHEPDRQESLLFADPTYENPLAAVPLRSPEDDRRFQEAVAALAGLRKLDTAHVDDLARGIEKGPARGDCLRWAARALGFLSARRFVEDVGPPLKPWEMPATPGGMSAKAWLSSRLVLTEKFDLADPSLGCQSPRVVDVTPTELAEQLTTSAYSDIRSALSFALDGAFRGSITSANAAFDRASQELRRYELIGRNALVVGFVGEATKKEASSNTFGWLLGPRLETSTSGRATLRYRQTSAHYPVTATLIAPVGLRRLQLKFRVFRISTSGEWIETHAVPNAQEDTKPKVLSRMVGNCHWLTLDLPTTPESIALSWIAQRRWTASRPRLLAARPVSDDAVPKDTAASPVLWRLQAGERKTALTILGSNLWRNPQVYVGGQRATRVQMFSDLGGLWAEFDEVRPLPGHEGKSVQVDLTVSTSRGTDRLANAVEILPPKAEAKPADPKMLPALQVVVPSSMSSSPSANPTAFTANVELRYELTPPMTKNFTELRTRVRRKGGAAFFQETSIDPQRIVFDPRTPSVMVIRGLTITKPEAWDKVEVLECVFQVRETSMGDLRNLHTSPLDIVVVQEEMPCEVVGKLIGEKKANDRWFLTGDTEIEITQKQSIDPAVLALLVPSAKPGEWAKVSGTLGSISSFELLLKPKPDAAGKVWIAKLSAEALLAQGASLPHALPLQVKLGEWRLSANVATSPK